MAFPEPADHFADPMPLSMGDGLDGLAPPDIDRWWEDHRNLHLTYAWLGDLQHPAVLRLLSEPWTFDDDYRTAAAVRDHEDETGHVVYKHAWTDLAAYCNEPDCGWTFVADPEQADELFPKQVTA